MVLAPSRPGTTEGQPEKVPHLPVGVPTWLSVAAAQTGSTPACSRGSPGPSRLARGGERLKPHGEVGTAWSFSSCPQGRPRWWLSSLLDDGHRVTVSDQCGL